MAFKDITDLGISQTALSDLYEYVQMDEKPTEKSKNDENPALVIEISMKIVFIVVTKIHFNYSTVVYGDFQVFTFEELSNNLEAKYFTGSFYTPT